MPHGSIPPGPACRRRVQPRFQADQSRAFVDLCLPLKVRSDTSRRRLRPGCRWRSAAGLPGLTALPGMAVVPEASNAVARRPRPSAADVSSVSYPSWCRDRVTHWSLRRCRRGRSCSAPISRLTALRGDQVAISTSRRFRASYLERGNDRALVDVGRRDAARAGGQPRVIVPAPQARPSRSCPRSPLLRPGPEPAGGRPPPRCVSVDGERLERAADVGRDARDHHRS